MTTEAHRASLWFACAIVLSVAAIQIGCAGSNKIRHGDSLDVSGYPDDIQAAYKVFAVRCNRCHTLARPLNARISDPQHWVRYVTRMRRNPESGINQKDGQVILHFLLYYMHQRAKEDADAEEAPVDPKPAPARKSADPEPQPRATAPDHEDETLEQESIDSPAPASPENSP